MFRALFATILVALLALPHGICFCELLQAAIVQKAHCDDDSAPDDHEKDCPCKLRHAMASLHTDKNVDTQLTDWLAPSTTIVASDVSASIANSALQSTPIDEPIPLIPCALRI